MNYKKFKRLSKEDRDEYLFLFHNKNMKMEVLPLIFFSVMVLCVTMTTAYSTYFIFNNDEFAVFKDDIGVLVSGTMRFVNYTMFALLIIVVWNAIQIIVFGWKHYRWKKKHNVGIDWARWREAFVFRGRH